MKVLFLLFSLFLTSFAHLQEQKPLNLEKEVELEKGKNCLMSFAFGRCESRKVVDGLLTLTDYCVYNSVEHKKASDYFNCLTFQQFTYQRGKCSEYDYVITGINNRVGSSYMFYSAVIKNTCYLNKNISEHRIDIFENGKYFSNLSIPFENNYQITRLHNDGGSYYDCFVSSVINCRSF